MRTGRVQHLVFVFVVLACSFVTNAVKNEDEEPDSNVPSEQSSAGEEESSKPITGSWEQVISNGWNHDRNVQIPNAVEFGGYTYYDTITGTSDLCGQHHEELGAEIWRTRDGKTWEAVVENGFGNPDNNGFVMAAWRDRLYVVARGAGAYTLWVSEDGQDYRQMHGPWTNDETADLAIIDDRLFLLAGSVRNGQGLQAWEISERDEFTKVFEGGLGDPTSRMAIGRTEPPELDGWAYFGIVNNEKGGEVWRSDGGAGWERSLTGGFDDPNVLSVVPHVVFKDHVYASSIVYPSGPNMLRTDDGTQWEKVIDNGFGLGEHHYSAAFLKEFKGNLYLVLSNDDPRMCGPGMAAGPSVSGPSVVTPGQGNGEGTAEGEGVGYSDRFTPPGFTLWKSADGKDWHQIGEPGFGNTNFFWAGPSVVRDYMYICAVNWHDGNKLWRSDDGEHWEEFFTPPPNPDAFGCAIDEVDDSLVYAEGDLSHGANLWRYGQ